MTDIAIFVEDPGAVAFIDGVPEALGKMGYSVVRGVTPTTCAVVAGTGEDMDWSYLMEHARAHNYPAIGLVDSCTSVEHRAEGLRYADYIAVPDEDTRRAYLELGFDPLRVRACGHPRHDALYSMRETFWNAKPIVMFATELSSSCDPLLDGDRRTEDAIERFLAAIALLPARPHLVLKLHPKTPAALYGAYRDSFDLVSGQIAAEAVRSADVVVGLTSSFLDEAVILGRPTITIAKPEERAALASWRHGLVPGAFDPKDIAEAIQKASPPDRAAVEAAFPKGGALNVARLIHDAIMEQVPTLTDGTVRLEPFQDRHLTERYVGWLNDPRTVRYSEQRHVKHTLESCRAYRATMAPPNKFWAIVAPPFGHVGNLSAVVDKHNRLADIAILIQPIAWGRGIGSRAWKLALDWLLGHMRTVTAGTMAENAPMRALMRKSGMTEQWTQRGRFLLDGVPVDAVFAAKEKRCLTPE